jgi:hypothetical protein
MKIHILSCLFIMNFKITCKLVHTINHEQQYWMNVLWLKRKDFQVLEHISRRLSILVDVIILVTFFVV